ncbi:LamG domain-containing protein [Streptomyces sp. NBC_00247]|uniref:LamG-like jellyroll fold domain-containing protein n=1 Tax=Streptomyces sp. NBC_00247 TaxID=2975689 RepID=UPI002E2CB9B2|nr:LamG-like jellyroll fold domain-containing protein [Streptomyces sp. NBC_00247]
MRARASRNAIPAAATIALLGALTPVALPARSASAETPVSYDQVVRQDSPVAYWPLATQDTATDSTGNGHTGTFYGTPSRTTLPDGEPATVFNGSSQYAEIPDTNDLSVTTRGVLTIEAWMRPDAREFSRSEASGYVHWLGKGTKGEQEYAARIYSLSNSERRANRISGYAFSPRGGLGNGSYFQDPLTPGQWIHYVLVVNTTTSSNQYPAGYTKIYKDGHLRDQDSLRQYAFRPRNGTAPLRIATRDLASFFHGAMGKVAVYGAELPATRIAAHHAAMQGV